MPKKFMCINPIDAFTTTSVIEARQHAANNPGHEIFEVDEKDDGKVVVTKIDLEQKQQK